MPWCEPTKRDLQEMTNNIARAEERGAVDRFAAERLRYVINTYGQIDEILDRVESFCSDLQSSTDFEFDPAAHMSSVGGVLDDLELTDAVKAKILDAIAKRTEAAVKEIKAEVKGLTQSIADACAEIDTRIEAVRS